ncbi:ERAD-associated E3 ubiquitin-protein ligase component HRD3A-like isoform X2 [Olea europaea var. sylvestris]|uniref:ERAD-associated E3 ubiquitin- ligase component HRD3A n=1 Tax=Olea europaea subsp. europaea TaxID=158383 RepID=A0A8S0TIL3_OLEEU|nr:ERAD-associated E3 ubiquitin-protein ligase component HRD3A-like isoform X2 [Olea europaea var. sylvestris]CAA3003413.1 ERAD-associated E3 ubiquitin- ligase component HRD3A [Olea europaea subsp. europaea]
MKLYFVFLLIAVLPIPLYARSMVLLLPFDDLSDAVSAPDDDDGSYSDSDEFHGSEPDYDTIVDPGSWSDILESPACVNGTSIINNEDNKDYDRVYCEGMRKMLEAGSGGGYRVMEEAVSEIEAAAAAGNPHAQSVIGFWYNMGMTREMSQAKAFLYHSFAADGGNLQSKMALAYTYYRQEMHDKAVNLYAELAEVAVNSFPILKDSLIETIRIHDGPEENKEALRKSKGEEDEDFQILEYQARKGDAEAMYQVGIFYYFGLRGVRSDHAKALRWFLKAVQKGEPRSMELLGEIYTSGVGFYKNYTKALEWLTLASERKLYSAYNGMGYLYVKGYGVEKNYTKAKEYFEKAADKKEPGGFYNLGVIYLKGLGVKRDLKIARRYILAAVKAGQPKAFYQLAKMLHSGVGMKKNLPTAIKLYKIVAECGPWTSLSRWAIESYLKGDVSMSFLLYSRMAEMGYEVAQSNAAWILDKYGEHVMCMGESGMCTDAERHQRVHSLWWQASEQGNEQAALLIGDAYYYGRGTERDYVRAAEAYMQAKSQLNAQAIFNLGYMHEHGLGVPFDLHLAKRYYDQALEVEPAAKLPVTLALASLWMRKNYANGFMYD